MQSNEMPPAVQSEDDLHGEDDSLALTQHKINVGFAVAIACLGLVGLTSYFSVEGLKDSLAFSLTEVR
jgi:hypothetical protein